MSATDVGAALVIGFAAGITSGLLGVGGGVLFVPALAIFLGLEQVDAEATSLLAMIPVALVGAWRQSRYGNVNVRDGVLVGLLSPVGVLAGALIAHVLPDRALALLFASVQLYFSYTFARRAMRAEA
jgi:uncharacterized membrane protein YfcA